MIDKIHKGKLHLACNQYIGRTANERGRTAKTGGHNFRQQKGERVDLQFISDKQAHGNKDEDGGYVIKEGGKKGGNTGEKNQYPHGSSSDQLCRLYRQELEYACFAEDVDDNHHAEEEKNNVVINGIFPVIKGFVLGNDIKRHHQATASQCNLCFIKSFRDN